MARVMRLGAVPYLLIYAYGTGTVATTYCSVCAIEAMGKIGESNGR